MSKPWSPYSAHPWVSRTPTSMGLAKVTEKLSVVSYDATKDACTPLHFIFWAITAMPMTLRKKRSCARSKGCPHSMAALKKELAGPDPLNILDLAPRQRASDAGHAGATRVTDRLHAQAEAARAFARLADLAGGLVTKLFEADRRR